MLKFLNTGRCEWLSCANKIVRCPIAHVANWSIQKDSCSIAVGYPMHQSIWVAVVICNVVKRDAPVLTGAQLWWTWFHHFWPKPISKKSKCLNLRYIKYIDGALTVDMGKGGLRDGCNRNAILFGTPRVGLVRLYTWWIIWIILNISEPRRTARRTSKLH